LLLLRSSRADKDADRDEAEAADSHEEAGGS
jgi:hypothetical protein